MVFHGEFLAESLRKVSSPSQKLTGTDSKRDR